ncbi:DUF3179 domain-containing protein [Haloarchaeobius sp. HRN-SO-5]|uniref:DUF3179 domain-containing protein n=1 Tax=Haloarchaeobius sp. HRN-SO-5 TaxID=3446118 RepID=UPI003EBCEF0F
MNVRQVVPRDAIPSVDDPSFGPVAAYDGEDEDRVVVVDGETPRAYPLRYLHYHEIVNATSDGDPVAVTWCPLCGSAVVYERTVPVETGGDDDGERRLTFGVSGKLADDDLVMYDRETGSEWKQSRGVAIDGPCEGTELAVVPAAVTTVAAFRGATPDGRVLDPPGGESEAAGDGDDPEPIDYDADPYERYFDLDGFGLGAHRGTGGREWDRDDVDPKTVVLGVDSGDDAVGFPLPRVRAAGGVVQTAVGTRDVVVFATDDGIHAFADPGFTLDPTEGDAFRGDGTEWDGATGRAADGRQLERLPSRRLFAFAWQDDHGRDAFYESA